MEAVPRMPMIGFELKTSPENAAFAPRLKQYIAAYYGEDPESYQTEIYNLEALRSSAVRATIDVSGCQMLKKYYCQLHFLKSRFPMEENQDAAIFFTWKDNYSDVQSSVPDIRFELMCVLYNIGALHSQLGAADSRVTPEGMKMSCTHFQCAAWAFQQIKEVYYQMVVFHSTLEVMHFMNQVALAQAQECILEKSMMDNRKATIIAKVAAQVVDYYRRSLTMLQANGSEDTPVNDFIANRVHKEWSRYLAFKVAYHKSIALLFQGQQAEEQQKMGERVAYYQAACDQLDEAKKLASGLKNQKDVAEALAFTTDVVEGKRKAAKNENEFIYHEEVPDRSTLQEVKGASLVKGISFSVNDIEVSGPDIFAKLVPMEAHEASSMYSEKKAKFLRNLGEIIETKDQELGEFMSALQLDLLDKMHHATGLPQEIVDRAAALSAKPRAIEDLHDVMKQLTDLSTDVESMLNEIQKLLQEEEENEKEYQEQIGKRPASIIATELSREAAKYKEAHNKATDSNNTLSRAIQNHVTYLRIMKMPLSQIKEQIPSIEFPNDNIDESKLKNVEMISGKVDEMKSQRATLWAQLRDAVHKDDITNVVVTRQPNQSLEDIFNQELQKHRQLANIIEQNCAAQENIVQALTMSYAELSDSRRYIRETMEKRDAFIKALVYTCDTYDDLLTKVTKGVEFYNKLQANVAKLVQRLRGACKVQQEERDQLMGRSRGGGGVGGAREPQVPHQPTAVATDSASATSITPTTTTPAAPKLKDYLDTRRARAVLQDPALPDPKELAAGATIPYPANITQMEGQSWPPGVRPAPLGSEMNVDTNVYDSTAYSQGSHLQGQQRALTSNANTNVGYYMQYPQATSTYSAADPYSTGYLQNVQYPTSVTPNNQYPMSSTPNNQTVTPSAGQYPTAGANYASMNTPQYPSSATQYTTSTNQYPTSNPQYPLTNPQYQPGTAQYTPSTDQYPAANTQFSSNTPYPSMNTQYSSMNTQYQATNNAYPSEQSPYPASNTQYPSANAQYSYANGQYSSANAQYPQYSTAGTHSSQYTISSTQYPTAALATSQYPSVTAAQDTTMSSQSGTYHASADVPTDQEIANRLAALTVSSKSDQSTHYAGDASSSAYGTAKADGYSAQYVPPQYNSNYNTQSMTDTLSQQYCLSHPQYNYSTSQEYHKNGTGAYNTYDQSYSPATAVPSQADQTPQGYHGGNQAAGQNTPIKSSYQNCYQNLTPVTSPLSDTAQKQSGDLYDPHQTPTSYYNAGYNSNYTPNRYHATQSVASFNGGTSTVASNNYMSNVPEYGADPQPQQQQQQQQQQQEQVSSHPPQQGPLAQQYASYGDQTAYYNQQGYSAGSTMPYQGQAAADGTVQQAGSYISTSSTQDSTGYLGYGTSATQNSSYTYSTPTADQQTSYYADPNQQAATAAPHPVATGQNTPYQPVQTPQGTPTASATTLTNTAPARKESYVDLLSDLDFSVSQQPLVPQQPVKEDQVVEEKREEPVLKTVVAPKKVVSQEDLPPVQTVPKKKIIVTRKPYDSPDVKKLFMQEVDKFEKSIDVFGNKTLSGPTNLDLRWKEIMDKQDVEGQKKIISVARCYPLKNRSADILPYDYSRVELQSLEDDYINASYVKDVSIFAPTFIVTQAPQPNTVRDFWTMVYEKQVELIVCLLNDTEMGSDMYWPQERDRDLMVANFVLTVKNVVTKPYWTERYISLSLLDKRESRILTHLQFTAWPGSIFPSNPDPFNGFVREVLGMHQQQRSVDHPVVVHCSSGIGRSGLLCLLAIAILEVTNNPASSLPDLVGLTTKLSLCRRNILRDREHLKFAHEAFLAYMKNTIAPDERKRKLNELVVDNTIKSESSATSVSEEQCDPLNSLDPFWASKRQS